MSGMQEGAAVSAGAMDDDEDRVHGERGVAAVANAKPFQARLKSWLASALFVGLAAAFILAWVMNQASHRPAKAAKAPISTPAVEAESSAPPLGPLPQAAVVARPIEASVADAIVGPPPPLPTAYAGTPGNSPNVAIDPTTGLPVNGMPSGGAAPGTPGTPLTPWQRRLESPVLIQHASNAAPAMGMPVMEGGAPVGAPPSARPVANNSGLAAALAPTVTPAVRARMLPTRRWLLPKGAFVDCTLETAIDSTLAGFTTCVTAVDILGADGTVVLLERGTKLVGEARADVRPGQSRVFVLWSEARTPAGVVADLASPGTDSLGRTGVDGAVDTHFADRFGAAILISIIDGAVQAAVSRSQSGGAVVVNPQTSS